MQLDDLERVAAEQDEGRWRELLSPVDSKATGIKLKVAGPDSDRQRKASFRYQNALAEANRRGKVTAERADELYLDCLAEFVTDIEVTMEGKPVAYSKDTVLRVIRAGRWVRAQLEQFAQERFPITPDLIVNISDGSLADLDEANR